MFKIYLITNTINDKKYVGQTCKTIDERMYYHQRRNHTIGKAFKKYGADSFTVREIDTCETKLQANWLESFYIGILRSRTFEHGYNLTKGGDGCVGVKHGEEFRRKLGDRQRGKIASEETRKKISAAKMGQKHTEETKQKMREWRTGRPRPELKHPLTDEHRRNIREGMMRSPLCHRRRHTERNVINPNCQLCVEESNVNTTAAT